MKGTSAVTVDTMAIFFTSDEHYGHRNIVKFCQRPFRDVDHMREELIARHNVKISKGDLVYHLGDMFWRTLTASDALAILRRLNGQHYYIRGNHEEVLDKNSNVREGFVWVRDRTKLKFDSMPSIVLDHYAGRVWDGSHRGSWQLYGHSHGVLREEKDLLSFDVGVDACGYAPISLEEVMVKMYMKAGNRSWDQVASDNENRNAVKQACIDIAKDIIRNESVS